MKGEKHGSKYRQVLFRSFVQRRSEKPGGRWRGSGVTGVFFMLHILQHVHTVKGVIVSCLKVSDTIDETESPKCVPSYQTASLSSRHNEPTVSLTSVLRNPMDIMLKRSEHELPTPPPSSTHPLFFPLSLPDNLLLLQAILKIALPFLRCSG